MKLPLWRLIAGLAIPCALAAVLLFLAPAYLANFRLQRYLRDSLTRGDSLTPVNVANEDAFRQRLAGHAHELGLPVEPGQVTITHPGGRTEVEIKYKVRKDFGLYQVDVHFDPTAAR